jgi:hypothetical protein
MLSIMICWLTKQIKYFTFLQIYRNNKIQNIKIVEKQHFNFFRIFIFLRAKMDYNLINIIDNKLSY